MDSRGISASLATILLTYAGPSLSAQSFKLNGPLVKTSFADSTEWASSPDGRWLVYSYFPGAYDELGFQLLQLHSVPLDGSSAPIVLSLPEFAVFHPFEVTNERVVYRIADGDQGNREWALLSSPLDGSALPTLLKLGSLVHEFRISPDGSRVVLVAEAAAGVRELFSVPIDRSSPPVRLNPPLVAGGDVMVSLDSNPRQYGFAISRDSQWVAYRADQETDGVFELYGVPADGSQPARKLSGVLPAPGHVARHLPLELGAENRVLFLSYSGGTGVQELFSVPVDGSQPAAKLNPASLPYVSSFSVSPDGADVLFTASPNWFTGSELFRVAIGGGAPVNLSGPMIAGGSVVPHSYDPFEISRRENYALDPVSSLVVYLADQVVDGVVELFSVPLDGSQAPRRLNQAVSSDGDVLRLRVSSQAGRVAYWLQDSAGPTSALFSVPLDGSSAPVRLRAGFFVGSIQNDFLLTADGLHVAFAHHERPYHLFGVPIDDSRIPVRLTPEIPEGSYVFNAAFSAISSNGLAYSADADHPSAFEIYTVPADGSSPATRRSQDLPLFTYGDVGVFDVSPDGRRVAFAAPVERLTPDLHSVPSDGLREPLTLASGPLVQFAFHPQSDRVLYARNELQVDQNLYSVPVDGGPPLRLNQPGHSPVQSFAAHGERVVFLDTRHDLWTVPTDGSQSDLLLSSGRTVRFEYEMDPVGGKVLFKEEDANTVELYAAPVEGSQPAVQLGQTLGQNSGGFVEISPDGSRVLFSKAGGPGLLSALVAGGSPAVQLAVRGLVTFPMFGPDPAHALYVDDFEVALREEVFAQPADGTGTPLKVSPTMPSAGDVIALALDADRTHAFYVADQDQDEVFELFRVSLAGGPSTKLNAPLVPGGDVKSFRVVGERVLYAADQDRNDVLELFAVPADGSALPVRLHAPLVAGGNVLRFQADPRGVFAVFLADAELDEEFSLYVARLDGPGTTRRLHPRPVAGGDVLNADVEFASRLVVFRGDLDENDTVELYSSALEPKKIRPSR